MRLLREMPYKRHFKTLILKLTKTLLCADIAKRTKQLSMICVPRVIFTAQQRPSILNIENC